ncbi:MAG: ABC transporter ATP-binding protein [Hyphomicrobiales bacterium]|nr:ABC transporter ATP-binding protein [Hyphomicrobiales bacterium]
MSTVEIIELSKSYGPTVALTPTNFKVEEGEFFSLLGPSGCGKTTTLRMIAGFVAPSNGIIKIGGTDVTFLPPEQRGIGIVFQNYAIFPHMNVFDNIAFGLQMRKVDKPEIARKVTAALEQVGLVGYEARFQREMSGGEQQRVALARVLVTEPGILLLDEPLSALDKKLREEMKYWIKGLQSELGITTIYVTHDQGEALTMSDRIAVMSDGRVAQIGIPNEIYEKPIDRFVTEFIGESNILDVSVTAVEDGISRVTLGEQSAAARSLPGLSAGDKAALVLRPEQVLLAGEAEAASGDDVVRLQGTVLDHTYQGAFVRYRVDVGGQTLIAEIANRADRNVIPGGSQVPLAWRATGAGLLAE